MTDHDVIATSDDGRFRASLAPDYSTCFDPRDNDGNAAVLVLNHTRYTLPSEGDLASEIDEALRGHRFTVVARWLRVFHDAAVVVPVVGYEHGALTARVGASSNDHDRWDGGLLGLAYVTRITLREELSDGADPELVIREEVEEWNRYLTGEVYGVIVEQATTVDYDGEPDGWDEVDARWGFIGREYAEQEARDQLAWFVRDDAAPTTGQLTFASNVA